MIRHLVDWGDVTAVAPVSVCDLGPAAAPAPDYICAGRAMWEPASIAAWLTALQPHRRAGIARWARSFTTGPARR